MKKFINRFKRSLWPAVLIIWGLMLPGTSTGTTVLSISFDELVQSSEFVFEGKVISINSMMDDNSMIRTCVEFQVMDVVKGGHPYDTLELCFLGGKMGNLEMRVSEMQYPREGETGIYFVETLTRDQVNPLRGWKQGHFIIENDPDSSTSYVKTADGRVVSEITRATERRRSFSTGTASNVKTVDKSLLKTGMSVDHFKGKIGTIIEEAR